MKKWIIKRWDKPESDEPVREIAFQCLQCRKAPLLEIIGIPEAQVGIGIVFDPVTTHSMPDEIECPYCGWKLEKE